MSIFSSRMMDTEEPLVFRIDEKLLQSRPPRLTLTGTLRALCERIKSQDLDANFVVNILHENCLLPYMISSNKNILDVSLGRNTNSSKVGDLIVSEECIRGSYELCISFLEFVLVTLKIPDYQDTTKTILASVTYLTNEIYTSHHLWNYKNSNDMKRILCLCTEIFHLVITRAKEPIDGHQYSDLEKVCIISLSNNQAHKQLLDVIIQGEKYIKKKLDGVESINEATLKEIPMVSAVRQSLVLFSKLLIHGKYVKDYCDIQLPRRTASSMSHYQHGASSSSAPNTNLERALFDTTIRPGLLQHLFTYVYQTKDASTACSAAELIKVIAKKFSMSLMACLGSKANDVCEFFVDCLSNKQANTELGVALLDLLSTCVKHQPGLIELFLNFKRDKNVENNKNSSSSLGSLEIIMNLLKNCKDREEDSQKLLHSHIMKFILTFWQKQHSAMQMFDKAEGFWVSITGPLVKFLTEDRSDENSYNARTTVSPAYNPSKALNDKLSSYSLRILAREIFCLNASVNERKMNSDLSKILEDLSKRNLLGHYSSFIKETRKLVESNSYKNDEYNRILASWRDFLTSCAKYKPFPSNPTVEDQIISDELFCLTEELRLDENLDKERVAIIGDTLLVTWTKWMSKDSPSDDNFNSIHELIHLADDCKEYLPFTFLLTFQSTLNLYLVRHREALVKSKRSFDLLVPSLQLMQFSFKVMEKYLNDNCRGLNFDYKPNVESRLCLASVMTLRFIMDVSRKDVNLWISYLQTNLRTDSLVQFLSLLMTKRVGADICLSVIELLLCLSTIPETATYLNKASLIAQTNMIAVSTYNRPYTHLSQLASKNSTGQQQEVNQQLSTIKLNNTNQMSDTTRLYLDNLNSDHDWLPIYWHVVRLNISMKITLGREYMETAVEFLSIHCIRICELFETVRLKPQSVDVDELMQVVYLINLVLSRGKLWKMRNRQSFEAISEEIAKTAPLLTTGTLTAQPAIEQVGELQQQRIIIKSRDCIVYARCCYDFAKFMEAEKVLFQNKFNDKNGFIKEASSIYGEDLSKPAFQLASLICLKTNRLPDSIDYALQVFVDDLDNFDILSTLAQECR